MIIIQLLAGISSYFVKLLYTLYNIESVFTRVPGVRLLIPFRIFTNLLFLLLLHTLMWTFLSEINTCDLIRMTQSNDLFVLHVGLGYLGLEKGSRIAMGT